MPQVRVQGPDGATTLDLGDDVTIAQLREAIATATGIAAASQELRGGFPPTLISAADNALLSSAVGAGPARIHVRPPATAGAGGGRKKAQPVRRVEGEAGPSNLAAAAAAGAAQKRDREDSDDGSVDDDGLGDVGGSADPLAATMAAERAVSGKKAAKIGKAAAPQRVAKVRARSAEEVAREYFLGSGGALSSAAKGGGKTGDFLTDHGMIEHRVHAVSSAAYELTVLPPKGGKGMTQLAASFKGVRKQVCEVVQLLDAAELREVVRALAARGSSSRGRAASGNLLNLQAMATRSPTVLWSVVHAFGGDVEGGVAALAAPNAGE